MFGRYLRRLGIVIVAMLAVLAVGVMPTPKASAQTPGRYGYPYMGYASPYPMFSYPDTSYSYPATATSGYAPSSRIVVAIGAPSTSYAPAATYGATTSYGSAGYSNAGYSSGVIAVAQSPQLGPYLTAGGMTLYNLSNDRPGVSACYGRCVSVWPPLQAPAGSISVQAGLSGTFGVILRGDGIQQVTYNGKPLYYFSHDMVPGDTNGQGITDQWGYWTVARP